MDRGLFREFRDKAKATYSVEKKRDFAVQYSTAVQILVETLGEHILSAFNALIPEVVKGEVEVVEESRRIDGSGLVTFQHRYKGFGKPAALARIIFLAHAVEDLTRGDTRNFERMLELCSPDGIKNRPFERTYFELISAARFARKGLRVEFLKEKQLRNSNGKYLKTPDLMIHDEGVSLLIECKSNVYVDVNRIETVDGRTKRILDRFVEGCAQIEEYGLAVDQSGVVMVQYFDNNFISGDREHIRRMIEDSMSRFTLVSGGAVMYDVFDTRSIHARSFIFGSLKRDQRLSGRMIEVLRLADPYASEAWTEESFGDGS